MSAIVLLLLWVAGGLFALGAFKVATSVDLTACGLCALTIAMLVGLNAPRIR